MFMEQQFGITVTDEKLSEENFATVRDIVSLVASETE